MSISETIPQVIARLTESAEIRVPRGLRGRATVCRATARRDIVAAVAAEREACAKVAEDFLDMTYTPDRIADLIRARGGKS